MMITRRKKTRLIKIGGIEVGSGSPITVQSMTTTRTDNIEETIEQIKKLQSAGCDIVRLAVPDFSCAEAIYQLKNSVDVPLVADIHFDYRLALKAMERGVDALRLNPGNIQEPEHIAAVVNEAKKRKIPIRIGVNAGSLAKEILAAHDGKATPEAMVKSAMGHIAILEKFDFYDIKVSLKAHDVPLTMLSYELMSERVDYPLHLGITEAGTLKLGLIKSAVGIGALLAKGIGDTVRVSLTADPVEEVKAANQILKSLGLRQYGPTLISCPTCGRCQIDLFKIAAKVEEKLNDIKIPLNVAVMGCVVNGPGEAKEADLGIAGGLGQGILFRKGKIIRKVPEEELVDALFTEIENFINHREV